MGTEIKKPVETTRKVNVYLDSLIKELEADNLNISMTDKIDIGALLDDIRKKAEDYVKDLKKELPLSLNKNEISGNFSRVEYTETVSVEIKPEILIDEVSEDDFFKCVKVSIGETKKILPEKRFNEIAYKLPPAARISFKIVKK